jgi:hypothetical protein
MFILMSAQRKPQTLSHQAQSRATDSDFLEGCEYFLLSVFPEIEKCKFFDVKESCALCPQNVLWVLHNS